MTDVPDVRFSRELSRYIHAVSKYGPRSPEATYVRLVNSNCQRFIDTADGIDRMYGHLSKRKPK